MLEYNTEMMASKVWSRHTYVYTAQVKLILSIYGDYISSDVISLISGALTDL